MYKFEVGSAVRITKNLCGHDFKIGETVIVTEVREYAQDYPSHECIGESGQKWWIVTEEGELVNKDDK